jgi:2'-5' RNA ligase
VIVIGATEGEQADAIRGALQELHGEHPEIPIVLGGAAVGGAMPTSRNGMRVLERIDEAVEAIEEQLATRTRDGSV